MSWQNSKCVCFKKLAKVHVAGSNSFASDNLKFEITNVQMPICIYMCNVQYIYVQMPIIKPALVTVAAFSIFVRLNPVGNIQICQRQ